MSTALERVRAYLDALDTLYDDDAPMPADLKLDGAVHYNGGPTIFLAQRDLRIIVEQLERLYRKAPTDVAREFDRLHDAITRFEATIPRDGECSNPPRSAREALEPCADPTCPVHGFEDGAPGG